MADDELDEDIEGDIPEDDEGERDGAEGARKKKRLLIIIVAVLLLVIGGVTAAYFTGLLQPVIDMLGGSKTQSKQDAPPKVAGDVTFMDLDEILVNLNTGGRKSTFLKIRVTLELNNAKDLPRIQELMPRVIDNFQVYLRELRIEDLKGSEGMYRLREELLKRVNAAIAPAKVNDVLFKEMLVQ
ncbi:flagellar basal body-associated FliL family protein [Varunaivibrio sulfuroxidans]|uniref:Flagellar protein FliL n=1 Tax=Varunaivibrio sulfuroxidans TaxID=1773489 RepID=A0A4R3JAW1_9PROT|nr:flagellar basal body-associated FliL family protein [Varunaivibrio sulfuroxidans]TCS63018.1 flagellar FliL protein [Varunaivibrio sulfuroxidans]WES31906.1 flagellar basal body-associated FliL family protein [Varunaivibrio sulfuroxidans]